MIVIDYLKENPQIISVDCSTNLIHSQQGSIHTPYRVNGIDHCTGMNLHFTKIIITSLFHTVYHG